MRVLLVSTYELGHQPLHLASPAAALSEAGHEVRTVDISVEEWDPALAEWAQAVAFSVPMHTATRLALAAAESVKAADPSKPVCFYGLYAGTAVAKGLVDRCISGEYEPDLVDWLRKVPERGGVRHAEGGAGGANGEGAPPDTKSVARQISYLPVRSSLPPLERYARLAHRGAEHLAGYVEASHGCAHRCRHCPVPVVYDGRTRRIDADVVLGDIAQQVEAGARHITFGDPDFLNRWGHAMRIVDELAERFPDLTYDVTTKVEHLLKHADLVGQLARTGCLFVVSAYECTNDEILCYLDKGHTAAEAAEATQLLRSHGIEPRPSWLPFTPWTTVEDVAGILDFVVSHDLVGSVDPVQYTIRLLVPKGSLMLDVPEMEPYLGAYDPKTLSYSWRAADPRTDTLQRRLAEVVEVRQAEGVAAGVVFDEVRRITFEAAGRDWSPLDIDTVAGDRPRLTEPWFCCAEPTDVQFVSVRGGRK